MIGYVFHNNMVLYYVFIGTISDAPRWRRGSYDACVRGAREPIQEPLPGHQGLRSDARQALADRLYCRLRLY